MADRIGRVASVRIANDQDDPARRPFSVSSANRAVRRKVASVMRRIHLHFQDYEQTAHHVKALRDRIQLLARIRSDVGEDINQSLHHYAVAEAIGELRKRHKGIRIHHKDVHPEQTGGANDPDIKGHARDGKLVCAEVTAHLKPQGMVDTRIRKALEKLRQMECDHRYYFVTTTAMRQRADTKLRKMKCRINVVLLDTGFDAIVGQDAKKEDA